MLTQTESIWLMALSRVPHGGECLSVKLLLCVERHTHAMLFIYSGYILGLVLQAVAAHQSGSAHPDLIHVTAHFIKSAMVGPFEVPIRTIKTGKGFKNLTATFVQHVHISLLLHSNLVQIG